MACHQSRIKYRHNHKSLSNKAEDARYALSMKRESRAAHVEMAWRQAREDSIEKHFTPTLSPCEHGGGLIDQAPPTPVTHQTSNLISSSVRLKRRGGAPKRPAARRRRVKCGIEIKHGAHPSRRNRVASARFQSSAIVSVNRGNGSSCGGSRCEM